MTADPLERQVQSIIFTDAEIKRLLNNAADEAGKIAAKGGVRGAQAAMANVSAQMWGGIGDVVKIGIGDAAYGALEFQAMFDESLFKAAGVGSRYWRASMIATSQQGIQSIISRKENGITLSDRVWKSDKATRVALQDTINTGLLLGKGPKEIAADVRGYLRPDVPGGASYAALRLGRSEVLNAYHTTSVRGFRETPWVDKVKWNLSGSHPRPDECNEYAESGNLKGDGIWSPDQVPAKPHPNCLCYVTPMTMDLDQYAKKFKAGEFDEYIDKQMGCYRSA